MPELVRARRRAQRQSESVPESRNDRGAVAEFEIMADLARQGFSVFKALDGHSPIDMIAADHDGATIRIQVKYRTPQKGIVCVHLQSIRRTKAGRRVVPMKLSAIDVIAVYCPGSRACFYVPVGMVGNGTAFMMATEGDCQSEGLIDGTALRRITRKFPEKVPEFKIGKDIL